MKKNRNLYAIYTLLFLALCLIVFYPFYSNGKSLVWGNAVTDGLDQHLRSVAYWGNCIRDFVSNIFHGKFIFHMWDHSIGYGADILVTLNYYAIGDPLNLIYGFATTKTVAVFFNGMTILRMYLAGLAFLAYNNYWERSKQGNLIGALVYVFSGFALNYGLHHPFFLNPMIYLPLLFLGIDKIYQEKKPGLFMGFVVISVISNFYFAYMLILACFLYGFFQFFYYKEKRERKIAEFIKIFGQFAGYFLLAIGISAVLFLPILIGFSNNGRVDGESGLNVVYNIIYYLKTFFHLFGYSQEFRGSGLNLLPIAFVVLLLMFFLKKKESVTYKCLFGFFVAALCIPFLGYVMHGFTYPSNRWTFLLVFTIAVLVVQVYPMLFVLEKKQKKILCIGTILYGCVLVLGSVLLKITHRDLPIGTKASTLLILLTVGTVLFMNSKWMKNKKYLSQVIVFVMVCFSVICSGFYHFSTKVQTEVNDYMDQDAIEEALNKPDIVHLSENYDVDYNRVETSSGNYNIGLLQGVGTTTNYFSITDKNVANEIKGYETLGFRYTFKFRKLNDREPLLGLHCVKYITVDADKERTMPDGFRLIEEKDGILYYENENVLPFGYTYDNYITKEEYDKLSSVEKEQTLLNSAVLTNETKKLKKGTKTTCVSEEPVQNIKRTIKVKEGQTVHVKFKISMKKDKENYVRIGLFDYSSYEDQDKTLRYRFIKNSDNFKMMSGSYGYLIQMQQKGSSYYSGVRGYTYKLKYTKGKNQKEFDLVLNKPGIYHIEDVAGIYVDHNESMKNLKQRKQSEGLENVSYGGNHFSGEINLQDTKMLCIPIPYSKGWTMYDNGKKVKTQIVNGMYTGILLEPGKHHIEMSYVTPGLKTGGIISLISLVITIMIFVLRRKTR